MDLQFWASWVRGNLIKSAVLNLIGDRAVVSHQQELFLDNITWVRRDVGSYLKVDGQVVICGGHNLPPLDELGLTDLPKPGWTMAHYVHPSPTSLVQI